MEMQEWLYEGGKYFRFTIQLEDREEIEGWTERNGYAECVYTVGIPPFMTAYQQGGAPGGRRLPQYVCHIESGASGYLIFCPTFPDLLTFMQAHAALAMAQQMTLFMDEWDTHNSQHRARQYRECAWCRLEPDDE